MLPGDQQKLVRPLISAIISQASDTVSIGHTWIYTKTKPEKLREQNKK